MYCGYLPSKVLIYTLLFLLSTPYSIFTFSPVSHLFWRIYQYHFLVDSLLLSCISCLISPHYILFLFISIYNQYPSTFLAAQSELLKISNTSSTCTLYRTPTPALSNSFIFTPIYSCCYIISHLPVSSPSSYSLQNFVFLILIFAISAKLSEPLNSPLTIFALNASCFTLLSMAINLSNSSHLLVLKGIC